MKKRHKFRFGTPVLLAIVAVMIGVYQSGILIGQLMPGGPEILTPSGEAVQIDTSSWDMPVAFVTVTWTPARTNGSYVLFLRDQATKKLLRRVTIAPAALPDRNSPSYQLSIRGLVPYTDYTLSVAIMQGSVQSPESRPKTFWIGYKDMPYEDEKPQILGPNGIITFEEAVLTWEAMGPRTIKNHIELIEPDDLDAFTITTKSLANPRSPSFNIPERKELKIDTEYQYRIAGEDRYGTKSQWSDYGTFTIHDQNFADAIPTLTSPVGEQNYFDNTFAWSPIPGAKYYQIEIRGDNNQESLTRTVYTDTLLDKEQPSLVIPNFPKNDQNTYVWYVTAYSLNDTPSQTSDMVQFSSHVGSFHTQKPVVIGQTGMVSKDSVRFSWEKLPFAIGYTLNMKIGTQNYMRRFSADDLTEENGIYEVTLPDFTFAYGTEYVFTVTAFDARYVYSQPSDQVRFRTSGNDFLTLVPVIVSPKGTVTSFDGVLHWRAVPGATEYRVSVSSADPARPFTYNEYISVSDLDRPESPSYSVPEISLEPGARYTFTIQGRNPEGYHSKLSEQATFDIELPAFTRLTPELVSPSGVISVREDVPVFLRWKPVEGADVYLITLNGGDGMRRQSEVAVSELVDAENPSLAFDSTLPKANATFAFTVQARNAEGFLSKIPTPLNFSFEAPSVASVLPVITGPLSGSSEKSSVTWKAVPGATSYAVWVRDYSSGKDTTVVNRSYALSELSSATAPSLNLGTVFKPGGIYMVWIRAEKQAAPSIPKKELSLWSKGFGFVAGVGTHGENIGSNFATIQPVINPLVSPTVRTPTVSWQPVQGAGSYEFFLQNNTNWRVEKVVAVAGTSTSYQLSPGATYTVWVRAIGGGEFSAWSLPQVFTVQK